jgi:lysophospholipase L1-like esterase
VGENGTGYLATGAEPGMTPYAGRLAAVVAAHPDVVVVQGSTNDVGRPVGEVGRAAADLYAQLAGALPDADIVVLGPVAPPGVDPAGVREVRDELSSAARAADLAFVDPIAGNWLHPVDGLFADPVHPDAAGYRELAADLVAALRDLGFRPATGG